MKVNRNSLIKSGDTTFDKIWAFFLDENKYPLKTQKLIDIKERWLIAWTLRAKERKSPTKAVNSLMKITGVNRAQAYRDIANAEKLFGNIVVADKEGKKAVLIEYIHKYLEMAFIKQDLDSIDKALKLLMRTYDIDKEDAAFVNFDKLEDKPIKLSVQKTTINIISKSLDDGVVDLNNPVIEVEAS